RVSGVARAEADRVGRLRQVLEGFSAEVTGWLERVAPEYAGGCRKDRVSYRPLEEAGRKARVTARNDLLHVDAFPTPPTVGHRILRVFANINPSEPRVWVTSDPFAVLLERYGAAAGLPGRGLWWRELAGGVLRLAGRDSEYDAFMRRFHDYLKTNDAFQA